MVLRAIDVTLSIAESSTSLHTVQCGVSVCCNFRTAVHVLLETPESWKLFVFF